jgi:hypothetical protein
LFKNLGLKFLTFSLLVTSFSSCASPVKWEGKLSSHKKSYMKAFEKFRTNICVPKAESLFEEYLRNYRGQGYWIPELNGDVDVTTIKSLLPELEKKLAWIKSQKQSLKSSKLPNADVIAKVNKLLKRLLELKKTELAEDEGAKTRARKASLKLLSSLQRDYAQLVNKVSFLSNYSFPVDHLKNRKVHDRYRDQEDTESQKISNYTFLYRKILEDGAYNKDHTSSDIYLRTTLDTLYYELRDHGFYISEDARYDLEFILSKIESELSKGKDRLLERLTEWEERTARTYSFYQSLTLPENQKEIIVEGKKTTPNRELIKEHNHATHKLKEFVYKKQAEVYKYWLNQPELPRAIFVLETILLNEVGGVDGEEALERMDVARVVMNRLDKPRYLSIGEKEFISPYLKDVVSDFHLKNEKWLNALFKQGEFSFTYYYMSSVAKIFCPDISPLARKLRSENVKIALQVLKEAESKFKPTRYFSRASMIGRIHMDTIWEDYAPYPERAGLLVDGQKKLLKAFEAGDYTYQYSFEDPDSQLFQVVQINGRSYALGEKAGIKLFYQHRNPHYFRYFTRTENL